MHMFPYKRQNIDSLTLKKKQPCYFSVMSLSRAHLKWMNKYMYDNDQFKVNSQEKNHIYEVLVFVLLQVQGVVWCKPCGNFCRVSTVVLLLVNRTFMKKITSKCKWVFGKLWLNVWYIKIILCLEIWWNVNPV